MDYCSVSPEPAAWAQQRTDRFGATDAARAVFLDEREKVGQLMGFLLIAGQLAEKRNLPGPATAEQLLARWPQLKGYLIPLAGPTETPPRGPSATGATALNTLPS